MATEVLMPKLGLTMTEGTIAEWKYKEGDTVKKGDILLSVETDKLTNDVEADVDGVLLKILLPAGETGPCKSVIAYIGAAGEMVEDATPATSVAVPITTSRDTTANVTKVTVPINEGYIRATPIAKRLAREKGYSLHMITGTGPNGVIVEKDVLAYVAGPKYSPMAAKLAAELGVDMASLNVQGRVMKADVIEAVKAPATTITEAKEVCEGNDLPPMKISPLRRSIATNMSASWATSPRVTYTIPVDVTNMKKMRAELKDTLKEQGIKLTYNHILMQVVAKALTKFPDVNASFADNMLIRHKHVNLGLAVAKGDGLIVPNVKCADVKSLAEIAIETETLIEATRTGKVDMDSLSGGTFTISNLGPYGITNFSPIINQPELAILGVCDMVDTPVVCNGEVVIRPMMNLCLTADHRVIDGVMASKFLSHVCELLEKPYLLLI